MTTNNKRTNGGAKDSTTTVTADSRHESTQFQFVHDFIELNDQEELRRDLLQLFLIAVRSPLDFKIDKRHDLCWAYEGVHDFLATINKVKSYEFKNRIQKEIDNFFYHYGCTAICDELNSMYEALFFDEVGWELEHKLKYRNTFLKLKRFVEKCNENSKHQE